MLLLSHPSVKAVAVVFFVFLSSTAIHFHQRVLAPGAEDDTIVATTMSSTGNRDLGHENPLLLGTTTVSISTSVTRKELDQLFDGIIEKWGMQNCTNARTLLETLWNKNNTYDRQRDVIVFYHPLKTGGTSVSEVLERLGGVGPGSGRSGSYNFKRHHEKLSLHLQQAEERAKATGAAFDANVSLYDWWDHTRVIFSHSRFRSYKQDHNTVKGVYKLLHNNLPAYKRVRHITMIREPLSFVASNMNEWFCRINRWVKKAAQLHIPTIPPGQQYHGCYGYSLRELALVRIAENRKRCENKTKAEVEKMPSFFRSKCLDYLKTGNLDGMSHCASIPNFLASPHYRQIFHNHGTYAKCTVPIPKTPISYFDGSDPFGAYVEGALEFLGGIDTIVDNHNNRSNDMMWVGVTERMHESMCLLHYQLQLPWVQTPSKRIQKCRPTSYWADSDKEIFYRREPLMLAVSRAANAVLDIHLAKMKYELLQLQQTKFQNNQTLLLEALPYVCPDQLS